MHLSLTLLRGNRNSTTAQCFRPLLMADVFSEKCGVEVLSGGGFVAVGSKVGWSTRNVKGWGGGLDVPAGRANGAAL